MDGIDPCSVGVVAVGGHLDEVDLAQQVFLHGLFGFDVALGLPSLVSQLEGYPCLRDLFAYGISLFEGPGHRFLAIDMLAVTGCLDGDGRMPVIRSGDDHSIDIVGGHHLLIGAVTLHIAGQLSIAAFAFNIGSRLHRHLCMDIEDVTDTIEDDVQVFLLHELLVAFVTRVLFGCFAELVDIGRMSKAGSSHQLRTAYAEADKPEAQLPAGRRCRRYHRRGILHPHLVTDHLLEHRLVPVLFIISPGKNAQHRH